MKTVSDAVAVNTSITFNESGSSIIIGQNVKLHNCRIIVSRNLEVVIGDNCVFKWANFL